ncbi:serine/threonine protein kinase [Trichodesmium erythraeum IMS101]|uniref:non-specific serine/threonine protein kinase n=1 Tax=Trichodesmium erythraeum (strain IMS101) TaxID=203124 RepID=Q10Z76_TRIEI|nr:serine/threonine protein kinase [Trichodesmium erythraeum GBRTRLIN201]
MNNPIYPGLILTDRYKIIKQLGHGGFGRTYLAEDNHRFQELCVLKEFAPQVHGSYALQKSQELFEREAGVLYKLRHPQIPGFREMFRYKLNAEGYLFLVQDYIKGKTYRALLENRKLQGKLFQEAEVIKFLLQLLPVLEYIHNLGVIHRDISPDNIILQTSDKLPVLIDFGGVKEIATKVASEYAQLESGITRLGKLGYAPDEQMRLGVINNDSDLYALAVTALVLLTGKEPSLLTDVHNLTFNWRIEISISENLGNVLDKMLASKPSDRFSTARQVITALKNVSYSTNLATTQVPPSVVSTPPVSPGQLSSVTTMSVSQVPVTSDVVQKSSIWSTILLVLVTIFSMGGIGWMAGKFWLEYTSNQNIIVDEKPERLSDRLQQLGIDQSFFFSLVDKFFYSQYPQKKGKILGDQTQEDQLWQWRWYSIADKLADKLETIAPDARRRLGNYSKDDIYRWRAQLRRLSISSTAFNDLTDARFINLFPEQTRRRNLIGLPIGQVWQAIATDTMKDLQGRKSLEEVRFAKGSFQKVVKATLSPGEGKIYLAWLQDEQILEVRLEPNDPQVLLSIYSPINSRGKSRELIEDSPKNKWIGETNGSGYYQFVVISNLDKPIEYSLELFAKNKVKDRY